MREPQVDGDDLLRVIFLRVSKPDIALIKFLFESYEGVAVVRTLDRQAAVIVLLISRDFEHVARGILESLRDTAAFEEIPPPPEAREDWLLRFVSEISLAPVSCASGRGEKRPGASRTRSRRGA